ncbi:5'-methylthioadenosine/S-adenosylhomocysteine nucleosidase family protein [Paractinoplanes durhamensis]|uniref:Nucleoside phosphorylase domain-containing protein n=1 Tax=Paractinoplanes durhamensis TaxID=113563 RepID=A0ABQ3ZB30_9ACTN|nr:hypothetical protein [Actinoplanes durhamensis]GIE07038.1 hypothetical protein Adu01nite_83880 [Actinoplanes durhamensis]
MNELTLAECRVAARSIRESEFGREAVDVVRPRGTLGVIRSRGPLSLLLHAAAREGRLIWRGPDSLALLQPPGDAARPVPDLRAAVAQRLVRGWDGWVLLIPSFSLLALAALSDLVWTATGAIFFAWALLFLVLGAVVPVAVLLACGVASSLVGFARAMRRRSPEVVPYENWSMVLCHHVQVETSPRLLLREVRRGLDRLLAAEAGAAAADLGVRMSHGETTEELLCLRRGVTTEGMRAEVDAWSERLAGGLSVRLSDHRAVREPVRIFDRGGFVLWYLGGQAVVLLVLARMVPIWERASCGDACAGRPVTYGSALRWLAQRLLFTDPDGLSPVSWPAWLIGWLVSIMSAVGVLVLAVALRQYVRARDVVRSRLRETRRLLNDRSRTLIMVVTAGERDAVVAAVQAVNQGEPEPFRVAGQVVLRLGVVSRTELMLAQVEPGAVGPGSAGIAAAALIDRLDLDFLILAGICYGLRPDQHEYGDVLVCDQLRAVDHRKVTDPAEAGDPVVLVRGDYVTPSTALLSGFRAAGRTWRGTAEVHFGPMVSASVLVNSRALVDELRAQQPDALGGEMEGAGVYAAAADAEVDWIVVKAISDWGVGKTDEHQAAAARNAAAFVVHAAREQALDDVPARGRR